MPVILGSTAFNLLIFLSIFFAVFCHIHETFEPYSLAYEKRGRVVVNFGSI